MKKFFTLLFWLVSLFVSAQTVDTAAVIHEVDSLTKACGNLRKEGNYQEAIIMAEQAYQLTFQNLGEEHPLYLKSLSNRVTLYGVTGDYIGAEPLAIKLVELSEKILGKDNPTYLLRLGTLANLYYNLGKFDESERLHLQALKTKEKITGKETQDYAGNLLNLSNLYREMGRYEESEKLLIESKEIFLRVLGKDNPFNLSCAVNLGMLLSDMYRYEEAEPILIEVIKQSENFQGEARLTYSGALYNLGIIYSEMGMNSKAEPLFREALNITEKLLGKEHGNYLNLQTSLAIIFTESGKYQEADSILHETLSLYERIYGTNHPLYATCMQNLAVNYQAWGRLTDAEHFYKSALTIDSMLLGKENPDYALLISNLAGLYCLSERFKEAESLLLESKTIREKSLGKENFDYVESCGNLSTYYMEVDENIIVIPYLIEENILQRRLLQRASKILSEREMIAYKRLFAKNSDKIYSLSVHLISTALSETGYDNCLFEKGFLLQEGQRIYHLIAFSNDTIRAQYLRWKGLHRQLSQEYVLPESERLPVEELEEKANNLEKELVRTVAGFGEALRQVTWQEVQARLKPGEAAIEFVHYNYYNPKPTDSTMYAALLLRSDDASPQFIPLFEEKSLDSLLQTQGERRADYVSNLYSIAERGAKPFGTPQKSLYELLWQPLEKELAGFQTIFFSPSGLLHRLNIGAIPISDEDILADRYQLVELGSTRQLVITSEVKAANQNALLIGGIKYEMDSTAISEANKGINSETLASTRGGLSFTNADSTLRGGTFNYLAGTEKEVTALEPILKSGGIQGTTRRGYTATEEAFKTIGKDKPSPRILHIATHGFFFPDPKTAVSGERVRSELSEPVFKISDHPMIRSGLILAGGNHAWQTGKPIKPDMEDGILTAYEISQMNLSNTELVVLSACETGLGDIEGNEGVYGLQRAFKIAGAKYLVMSLWKVPDHQTQELMTTFYKRWLEDKMTIPDAFRSAQKEMREKYQVPYFWAGFVLVE